MPRRIKSGRYQARILVDGERVTLGTFLRKKDATDAENDARAELRRGTFTDPRVKRATTVGVMLAELLRVRLTAPGAKPSTIADTERIARRFVKPRWKTVRVVEVTETDAQVWVNELAARSPANAIKAGHMLKACMERATRAGITPNPLFDLRLPKPPRRQATPIPPDGLARLADELPPEYRAWLITGVVAGLRFGELAALEVDNVDFANQTIDVRQRLWAGNKLGPPKSGRAARVNVPTVVLDAIASHVSAHVKTRPARLVDVELQTPGGKTEPMTVDTRAYLFTTRDGYLLHHPNFMRRVWKPAAKRAGLEGITPHDLRHTVGSLMARAGFAPKMVQNHLRHASGQVTIDIYTHEFDDADQLARDGLQAAFGDVFERGSK